jgi:hypothetical protein
MRRLTSGLCVFLISATAFAQRSALTASSNIAHLSQQAVTIVHGHIVAVRVEPHPQLQNLTTVVVTLRVLENFKGTAPQIFSFRQFVWDIRDKQDAAGYRKGQEVLLLLNANSSYGLTSPAGMEQGRFEIFRDAKGVAMATNGLGNVGLFANMSGQLKQPGVRLSQATSNLVAQHRSGAVPLSQLEEVIRQFEGAPR